MISVVCPHCKVGLKVDEAKIPTGILFFKCPKCKKEIPISYVEQFEQQNSEETVVLVRKNKNQGIGRLTVLQCEGTPAQEFQLQEGENTVGRRAKVCTASVCILTGDKTMSRSHLKIEVKKNQKGEYLHYLSDNNSINHTLYNGKNIESGDIVILKDGDKLVMGKTTVCFNE